VMLQLVVILKAVVEVALCAFLGQGVLYVLAGSRREQNFVYGIFKMLTSPVMKVARMLSPRFVLADTPRRFITLASISTAAACVAGSIFAAYVDAPLPAHAASCVFAGSCLALVGILVPLPTPTSHALGIAAATIAGPSHDALTRAAAAHQSSRWQPRTRQGRRQWGALLRLSDERAALERAGGAEQRRELDQRIDAAVRELAPSSTETVTSARADATDGTTVVASKAATDTAPTPASLAHDSAPGHAEEISITLIDAEDGPPTGI